MVIRFDEVSKKYKNQIALKNMCVVLREGIYGLLGPNGAGKSTFMKMMVGNLQQTAGCIFCDDEDIRTMGKRYRTYIGYMPQQQEMYPYFTGRRFLSYMAALKGLPKAQVSQSIEEVAGKANLMQFLDRKIGGYSGGMKQRLLVAQALMGNPRILVLDEPTAGLDPKERIRIRNLISENAQGKIVIIATHVVQDIECIADHIMMLKQGELAAEGTPEQLLSAIENYVWELKLPVQKAESYLTGFQVSNVVRCKEGLRLRVISEAMPDKTAVTVEPDLEDYYLYLYHEEQ